MCQLFWSFWGRNVVSWKLGIAGLISPYLGGVNVIYSKKKKKNHDVNFQPVHIENDKVWFNLVVNRIWIMISY